MEAATIESPPTQTPSAADTGGISSFAEEMAATVAKATKANNEQPVETATTTEAEKTVETPKEEKVETVKEEPKEEAKTSAKEKKLEEMTSDELDAVMKKAPSKAWKVYDFFKNKTLTEIAELKKKLETIQAKPVESAADAKKVEAYEKQIKDLQSALGDRDKTLSEVAYEKSPEFQQKYVAKYNKLRDGAAEEFKRLNITEGETQRQATVADWNRLMKRDAGEQFELVKQWLGDTPAAQRLLIQLSRMEEVHSEALDARNAAYEQAEKNRIQSESQSKEEAAFYESQLAAEQKDLAEKLPDMFGDTDNKEAAEVQQKGREFARKALMERASMSPRDRAAYDAALIESHAYARRAVIEMKAMENELEALKAELAKFRKTDPGSDLNGKAPKAAAADDDSGGIESMASVYKRAF